MPVGSGSWCYYESQARKFLPLGEKLKLMNKFVEAALSCIVLYTWMYFWALLEVACLLYRLFYSKKSPQSPRKSYSKYFYLVNCYKVNLFQVSFQPNNPGSFWFCFRVVLIDSKI